MMVWNSLIVAPRLVGACRVGSDTLFDGQRDETSDAVVVLTDD